MGKAATSEDFYHEDGILNRISVPKRNQLIGELVSLLLCSPLHRRYLINDIGAVSFRRFTSTSSGSIVRRIA